MALAAVVRLLDGVRVPVLRLAIARSPRLRRAAASRPYRLELFALTAVLGALLGALVAPVPLFVWGPLVLGVPHLLADVRYLLLRPYGPVAVRGRDLLVLAALAACAWSAAPTVGGLAVLAAIALAPCAARGRQVAALLVAAALYAWAATSVVTASYVVMHGHNVIAIGVAGLVLVRGRAGRLLVFAAGGGAALILGGAADPLVRALPAHEVSGYVLPEAAFAAWSELACARVAVAFVFLQGVHYAAWLRLVPDALRPRPGMRGFAASLRALERDVSRPAVAAVAALALGLLVAGAVDAWGARAAYLRLAGFHAYLELAVLARWLVTRGAAEAPR